MSKPKSSIRDYGYNPNQAISLRDMEDTVTTEGMRMAGKVEKHSEFMRPNENNDYSDMEYKYPYPSGTMPPTDWVGPGSGWPGNPSDCQGLWNKLFPKHKTGTGEFVPDRNDNIALDKYIKSGCPVDYIPTWCCPGVKISGPKEVDVSSTTQYSLTGAKVNCDYIWNASAGRIPGGTFYAPDSPQTVTISVEPFMGDDSSRVCNSMQVKVKSGGECGSATIGITSNQMNVGTSQTLTVLNPNVGTTYSWVISSGGGSLSPSTGNSTTYTAPASNANCLQNPTIQLIAGGLVCHTVTIAVNADSSGSKAYAITTYSESCSEVIPSPIPPRKYYSCKGGTTAKSYGCAGAEISSYSCNHSSGGKSEAEGGCAACLAEIGTTSHLCQTTNCRELVDGAWVYFVCDGGKTDLRTAAMKANGCCPYQLV